MVNDPSPRVLRRVAAAFGLPYTTVMELAGYLDGLDSTGMTLDVGERRAVLAFIDLTSRRTHAPTLDHRYFRYSDVCGSRSGAGRRPLDIVPEAGPALGDGTSVIASSWPLG